MKRIATRGPESAQAFTSDMVDVREFWSRVDKSGECWIWKGQMSHGGYGTMQVPKLRAGPVNAHRVSYVLAHGTIAPGMVVLHSCDNPPCVNPAHLTANTQGHNIRDAIAKGRQYWQRDRTCDGGHFVPANSGPCRTCHQAAANRAHRQQRMRAQEVSHATVAEYFAEHIAPLLPATLKEVTALTDSRRAVVFARLFGLFGFAAATGAKIGADYGITRERVRQLRNDVLRKLGGTEAMIRSIPQSVAWKKGVDTRPQRLSA